MGAWLRDFWNRWRVRLRGSRFLCDACRYNYGSACWRPERPNATRCPDFKGRF